MPKEVEAVRLDMEDNKLSLQAKRRAIERSKKSGIHEYLLLSECYKEVVREYLAHKSKPS